MRNSYLFIFPLYPIPIFSLPLVQHRQHVGVKWRQSKNTLDFFYVLTKSALSILWDFTAPLLTPPPFVLLLLVTYSYIWGKNIANVIYLMGRQLTRQEGRGWNVHASLASSIWARRSNSTFLLHSSRHSTGWAIKTPSSSRCWAVNASEYPV